jgi:glyoxylase-like metal-dependent hydrolase (beta-lactamase superfamily II)
MKITPFHESESGTWTYLLADEQSGNAAIIDPVWVYDIVSGQTSREFVDQVLAEARRQDLNIRWVLKTHAHADHLTAAALIRKETGAKVAIGRGICSVQEHCKKIFNLQDLKSDGSQFDRLLSEGDSLFLGGLEIRVMETPGHTDDSVTYLAQDAAFIGDTLFAPDGGTARCDFPGGSASKLFDTIQRIYALPASTRLFLCHNYPAKGEQAVCMATVEDSSRENIHVGPDTSREDYVQMREARDATLNLPKLIYPSVQVNILAGSSPVSESNGHQYLKIPFNTSIAELLKNPE